MIKLLDCVLSVHIPAVFVISTRHMLPTNTQSRSNLFKREPNQMCSHFDSTVVFHLRTFLFQETHRSHTFKDATSKEQTFTHTNNPHLFPALPAGLADLKPPPTALLFSETPLAAAQSSTHASLCSAPLSDPVPTQELWSKIKQTLCSLQSEARSISRRYVWWGRGVVGGGVETSRGRVHLVSTGDKSTNVCEWVPEWMPCQVQADELSRALWPV